MSEAPARLSVIGGRGPAVAALHPLRRRILEELREPASATAVAESLGLARQKVNYHVRKLEEGGLVEEVERRRKGNCVERIVRATARHYLISPELLGQVGAAPEDVRDRFSSTYLVALAARTIREVASLREGAQAAGKRLPTMTLDTEIRFADARSQVAFANEMVEAFTEIVARHHAPGAPEGRSFRLVFTGYPSPAPADAGEDSPEPAEDGGEPPRQENRT